MDWFFFSLLASFMWALSNVLDEKLISDFYKDPLHPTIVSALVASLIGFLYFFVDVTFNSFTLLLGIGIGIIWTLAVGLYFKALTFDSASLNVTIMNSSDVFVLLLAFLFLGEILSPIQYFGALVIILSVFFISITDFKTFKLTKSFYYILGTTLLFAVSAVLSKYLYNNTTFLGGLIAISIGFAISGVFLLLAFKSGRALPMYLLKKKKWVPLVLLPEITNTIAVFVSNLAISLGPISLVSLVESGQPIYVLLLIIVLSFILPKHFNYRKEKYILRKLTCMMFMVAGLYLITL